MTGPHPPGAAGAGETRRLRVEMAAATAEGLRRGGYALFAFRAVATAGTAFPLVCRRIEAGEREMEVAWTDALRVFASAASIGEGAEIAGGGEYPVRPGQTLEVMTPDGRGPVEPRGAPGMVTVVNTTQHQLACGLSAPAGDGFARGCALPLYPRHVCVAAPVDRVLLAFAAAGPGVGCVAMRAPGEAVLVDLSAAAERRVEYDRVRGWSWQHGAGWARVHPAGSSLVSLLVERTAELRDGRAAALERLARDSAWRPGHARYGGSGA